MLCLNANCVPQYGGKVRLRPFLFGLIFAQVFKQFLAYGSKHNIHRKRQHVQHPENFQTISAFGGAPPDSQNFGCFGPDSRRQLRLGPGWPRQPAVCVKRERQQGLRV
jgi:hypothetical protein